MAAALLMGLPMFGTTRSRREMADMVLSAVPVLWLNEIQRVAFAHNLPRHIVGDLHLPHDLMYWTFEGSLPDVLNGRETGAITDCLLVENGPTEVVMSVFRSHWERHGVGQVEVVSIRRGMRYPEDFTGGLGRIGQMLQAAAFMTSPYVELQRERTHEVGAKAKWHGRRIGDPQAISVVRLRSTVHAAVEVEAGRGPQWKQRWLVRGHYRAQWYPSTQTHRIIWIAPYLKGPEDAPVKTPVYVVDR